MRSVLLQLLRQECGVTSIEYGFIALLIALAIVTATTTLGATVAGVFSSIAAGF